MGSAGVARRRLPLIGVAWAAAQLILGRFVRQLSRTSVESSRFLQTAFTCTSVHHTLRAAPSFTPHVAMLSPAAAADLQRLRRLLSQSHADWSSSTHFSTGFAALDRLLPSGGLLRGSLIEWLSASPGAGAGLLAVAAAIQAQRPGNVVVVIDRERRFYPPAAAAWGLDLSSAMLVHPANFHEEQWAVEQALRAEHVAAVIAHPPRLDARTFRRFQLAAEASGAVGLLVRPASARPERSWAAARWLVEPQPSLTSWRLRIRLLHCRGRCAAESAAAEVDLDEWITRFDATHACHLAPELAHSTAR